MHVFCRPEPSLEGILKWWVARSHLKDGAPMSVVVHGGKLLQSTFRAVSRPNFNFLLPFHVSFSGEIGDDLGGPKREFFRYNLVRFIYGISFCKMYLKSINFHPSSGPPITNFPQVPTLLKGLSLSFDLKFIHFSFKYKLS